MTARPTKTTNRIHFDDLAHERFEDLCLALVYPLRQWAEIRHYGRSGGDQGVDIHALEVIEDGTTRRWSIQCRRYAKASRHDLEKAIDDVLGEDKEAPDVVLVVVACNISRKADESYHEYAREKGISTSYLWTASILEARLYAERKDLLFSYFGISQAGEARQREASVMNNLTLKKKLRKLLLKNAKSVDWNKARNDPPEKFQHSEVIVHSIDDSSYPEIDDAKTGISGWFKLEIWNFYHNGLEFIIGIDHGIIDQQGRWAVIKYDQEYDETKYREIKLYRIARIPYRNIVEIDMIGDEYYPQPHIYCRFADGGTPYEAFQWVLISDEYPYRMNPEQQLKLEEHPTGE